MVDLVLLVGLKFMQGGYMFADLAYYTYLTLCLDITKQVSTMVILREYVYLARKTIHARRSHAYIYTQHWLLVRNDASLLFP